MLQPTTNLSRLWKSHRLNEILCWIPKALQIPGMTSDFRKNVNKLQLSLFNQKSSGKTWKIHEYQCWIPKTFEIYENLWLCIAERISTNIIWTHLIPYKVKNLKDSIKFPPESYQPLKSLMHFWKNLNQPQSTQSDPKSSEKSPRIQSGSDFRKISDEP